MANKTPQKNSEKKKAVKSLKEKRNDKKDKQSGKKYSD